MRFTRYVLFTALFLLNACGGSSSTSPSTDSSAPSASILFPPRNALINGDFLTVRGTSNDEGGVASIRVNGVTASTSNDFATWSAIVPVTRGLNTLSVEATDNAGNTNNQAVQASVQNELISPNPRAISFDSVNERALVLDRQIRALITVDLNSGNKEILSNDTQPNSINALQYPEALAIDTENNRALVLDIGIPALIAIDLTSGARTVISSEITRPGPNYSMDLDLAHNRVLISYSSVLLFADAGGLINNAGKILAIDLTTGETSTFADETVPDSVLPLENPGAIAVDITRNRLIVIENNWESSRADALIAIDLDTGARSLFSDELKDGTALYASVSGVTIDAFNNRILVYSQSNKLLMAFESATGERTILMEGGLAQDVNALFVIPGGIIVFPYTPPNKVALDTTNNRLMTTATFGSTIEIIDLTQSERAILSDISHVPDESNIFSFPSAVTYDDNRLFVADPILQKIILVDTETGLRTPFYDIDDSTTASFQDIEVDQSSNRLFFFERLAQAGTPNIHTFVSLDLTSGEKTVISSDAGLDEADRYSSPGDIALDVQNERAFVSDKEGIITVDFISGDRELIISKQLLGSPDLSFPVSSFSLPAITLDKNNNQLLFVDRAGNVQAMDLDTKFVTTLSPSNGISLLSLQHNDIVVDESRNRALLIDYNHIVAIDLDTGERTDFSTTITPDTNTIFFNPRSMTIDKENERVIVLDTILNAIYAVDLHTGQRVILSR